MSSARKYISISEDQSWQQKCQYCGSPKLIFLWGNELSSIAQVFNRLLSTKVAIRSRQPNQFAPKPRGEFSYLVYCHHCHAIDLANACQNNYRLWISFACFLTLTNFYLVKFHSMHCAISLALKQNKTNKQKKKTNKQQCSFGNG